MRAAMLERGFGVVRGFLLEDEIAAFADDARRGEKAENGAYTLLKASPARIESLHARIGKLLSVLSSPGVFAPNRIGGGIYFATDAGINFGWHQDHESYFLHQSHRHYLNVYVPVIKPEVRLSNLVVVPADRFRARAPALWKTLEWGGACSADVRPGSTRTTFRDDHAGAEHGHADFLLDEIAETPELAAGDALLMRGDLFHRTQDTSTARVALSIRVSNDMSRVCRTHFEQSCEAKSWFVERNPQLYDAVRRVFARRESLIVAELLAEAFGPAARR